MHNEDVPPTVKTFADMRRVVELGLTIIFRLTSRAVSLALRYSKELLWKSIRSSSRCSDPTLTILLGTVTAIGFVGAVLSVYRSAPDVFSIRLSSGFFLNVLSLLFIYVFMAGKLLKYSVDLLAVRRCLFNVKNDLIKIGADRSLDYLCECVWHVAIRACLATAICIGHHVWQPNMTRTRNTEMGFLALYLIFLFLQLRYLGVQSHLEDASKLLEIHVFNSQTRLKKKWQLSIMSRAYSTLTATLALMFNLHRNHSELAATYSKLVFATLSSYLIITMGDEVILEHPLTCSCSFFQLLFIFFSEADLRMMYNSNKAILKKIRAVRCMLDGMSQHSGLLMWRLDCYTPISFFQVKYLKKSFAHAITMGAAACAISFHLRHFAVSQQPIKEVL